jgi:adenylate cyclase
MGLHFQSKPGHESSWSASVERAGMGSANLLAELASSSVRRRLRMASGLVLFTYIGAHLVNHALGLISLETAERGMSIAIEVWYSVPGTLLLYGAAATHFLLALWAVYERRTFRLPPAELLRIALGFTLPMILIGHAANTRLAYEMFALDADYTRVVSNLWATDAQGLQLGLLAPGWLHGCLGLNFAFNRRPLFRRLRFVLFAVALLLPVFSALGFVAMGRELSTNPVVAAAAQEYLGPKYAAERIAIAHWRDSLLVGYFAIIGVTFGARAIRNLFERSRQRLVSIAYPGRTVRVPRGWSVLEASRAFHLAHASMCGGRARCSTCRVRVTAGEDFCPAAAADERATLDRIGAPPDVRLACQLRPRGDVSVIPLVRTERPIYRPTAPHRSPEREIVVLFCDFLNRAELAGDHLPQDLLYVLTLYVEALGNAIRAAHGTPSYVEPDSTCALFGLECDPTQAAQQALRAASVIEAALADLNDRLGRQWDCKVKIAVSIHAGRAAVGEIGSSEPPAMIAIGEAIDVANEMRKAAAARDVRFAISEQVYAAAGLAPAFQEKITVAAPGRGAPVGVCLSISAPPLPQPARIAAHSAMPRFLRRLRA